MRSLHDQSTRLRRALRATTAAIHAWAWGPLVGKAMLWLCALSALAYVGGRAAAGTPPRAPAGPVATASASGSEAANATSGGASPAIPGIATNGVTATSSAASTGATSASAATPSARTTDGRIVLNLAAEADLRQLPGVGAKRAQAVLALRNKLGRFTRLEQLLRVRGIGPRTLARLRPLVVLDAP